MVLIGLGLVVVGAPLRAQTNAPAGTNPAGVDAFCDLGQVGPVGTAAQADETFAVAASNVAATGGGVVVIPRKAPAGWSPRNNRQDVWRKPEPPAPAKQWGVGPGVTVVDPRGANVEITTPQVGGLELNRTLDLAEGESLPFWGYFPMLSMRNTVLHGSTSYREWLMEDVKAGKDRRFYVQTIRGVFPGEFMSIGEYGVVQRLYVKSLGYDKDKFMWYFVADADQDISKGAIMGNKNHVNVAKMETFSHNENQTCDVLLERHNFSQGDNYMFYARFKYMGDNHSTAGDENAVLYGAFINSEADIFRGKVETWNPETGELKYRPGAKGDTLGSGRPIINLNPAKWMTNGAVVIVRAAPWTDFGTNIDTAVYDGRRYPSDVAKNTVGIPSLRRGGLIRFPAGAGITKAVIGRYFAVDEADEYVPMGKTVRRWYLINSVDRHLDGSADISIIRHWWGAKDAGGVMLYKPANYSADGRVKPLKYIIAPGANAYDVSDGVNGSRRTVRLVPTSFTGTPADFAPGDDIEQAIGPDPFKPIAFRAWTWDAVPGAFPAPLFDIANQGQIMRETVFSVRGGSGSITNDWAKRYDRNPIWDTLFSLHSTCNNGITFGADVANAAILFTQPNQREQPIGWLYGTDSSQLPKQATLTVSRETGDFNFKGGDVRLSGSLVAGGLSAGPVPARNLRGKNVPVKAGDTSVSVAFAVEETDDDYAVFIEPNWVGNHAVSKKGAKGFEIEFEKPAPRGAKLDWMIVR